MAYVDVVQIAFEGDDQIRNLPALRSPIRWIRVAYAPTNFTLYSEHGTSIWARDVSAGDRLDIELPAFTDQLTVYWPLGMAVPGAAYAKAVLIVSNDVMLTTGDGAAPVRMAVYDSLGQIRGWHPLTADSSVVERIGALVTLTGSIVVSSITGIVANEQEQQATYDVVPRRTARDYSQTYVFGAAGRQVMDSLWLPSGPAVDSRLVAVDVAVMDASAACEVWIDLIRINSQPTGGTSYTPVPRKTSQVAATTQARKQPSGGAAETGDALSSILYKLGVTGAVSVVNPAPPIAWQPLYRPATLREQEPTMLPGEGLAVVIDCNAAATVRAVSRLSFMEDF